MEVIGNPRYCSHGVYHVQLVIRKVDQEVIRQITTGDQIYIKGHEGKAEGFCHHLSEGILIERSVTLLRKFLE